METPPTGPVATEPLGGPLETLPDEPSAPPYAADTPPVAEPHDTWTQPYDTWAMPAQPLDPADAPPAPPPPLGPPVPPPAAKGRSGVALMLVVALIGGLVGALVTRAFDGGGSGGTAAVPRSSSADRSLLLSGDKLNVAGVVDKVEPGVVTIQSDFGLRGGSGAGTGVILTSTGEILTNAHVVQDATGVRVTLAGESQARTAEIVGTDPSADLALLSIPGAKGLPTVQLGKSSDVAVGDDVVAIGNALALRGGPTVTKGIISALDRTLDTENGNTITGLLQTDASISSGNSGGPLVNAAGQVIGINTAVASSGRGSSAENIGFAIPIDQALPVVDRLRNKTTAASQGFLGVSTADPTDGSRGATVMSVAPGSAAATAGIQEDDLITKVDGKSIDGAAALAGAVHAHRPGDTVELQVIRDGAERTVKATLSSQPRQPNG